MTENSMEILKNSPLSKPRMMGTEGEKETVAFLKQFLTNHSLKPLTETIEWSTASVNGRRLNSVFMTLFIVFFNIAVRLRGPYNGYIPIASLFGMFGFLALFLKLLMDGKLNFLGKSFEGENILCRIGTTPEDNVKKEVFLTAHYDSVATTMPKFSMINIVGRGLSILVILLLTFTTSIMNLVRFYTGTTILNRTISLFQWIILGATILASILVFLGLFRKRINGSDGICDNGSGSSVLLKIASYFQQNSLENVNLTFMWCAAEEWGLYGSRQYVKAHKEELLAMKDRFYLINVDMVGQEIAYIEKKGILRKKPLNKTLNKLIKESAEGKEIEVRGYKSMLAGSSDHAPFKKQKLEVAAINSRKDFRNVHSKKDTIDIVKPENMSGAVELIKTVIQKLNNLD